MAFFLWIGSAFGATLGLLHALYLYRQIAARYSTAGAIGVNRRGLYYGIWTFALWTIFGSYVLAFWLVGGIANVLLRLTRGNRAP
jgi:hypothetical protein